jgi:hypothetical protein
VSKVGIGTRLLLSTALSIGAASALSSAAGAADILGKAPVQQQGAANVGYADGIRNDNSGRGGNGVYDGMTFVFLH